MTTNQLVMILRGALAEIEAVRREECKVYGDDAGIDDKLRAAIADLTKEMHP
jgi:hypothetical protein